MVLGTASHVGKSVGVAALCRIMYQDGFKVAPFKAQNMALNSFATREGHEIGRAQAVQAFAAGLEPHVDMNPVLLKPSSDCHSQVVLNGRVWGSLKAANFRSLKPTLFGHVLEAYQRLCSRYDFIILEGAGSPVEMNLKDADMVNLSMAAAAGAKCILIADIDRGGVFASLVGTYALLAPEERSRFGGFIINKFRGDPSLLTPGVKFLEDRLEQPCLGVVPFMHRIRIDEEDSVALESEPCFVRESPDDRSLRVSVVRLPHLSNFSDFSALREMNGVAVYYSDAPSTSSGADVIVIPGTKNTIGDLGWLRSTGWADRILAHARAGKPVIGICGGFQMLGNHVLDPERVEDDAEAAAGLGLLDIDTRMTASKVTRQATASLADPEMFSAAGENPLFRGYEIHMGETRLGNRALPLLHLTRLDDETPVMDGAISADGLVLGTYLHGLFDVPEAARLLVSHWRRAAGKPAPIEEAGATLGAGSPYDELAAHFRRHLDVEAIYSLLGIAI
jgi:adenosylcobyric acid synthase